MPIGARLKGNEVIEEMLSVALLWLKPVYLVVISVEGVGVREWGGWITEQPNSTLSGAATF